MPANPPPPHIPDQRSEELLTAVRRAFAEKGFDGASMQDLARAAGISPGNFYRYFPSKAAIVEALLARDRFELDQQFAQIHLAPNPVAAARELFRARIELARMEDCQIWAEMTAAAMRKPELAEAVRQMHESVIGHLIRLFARATGLAEDDSRRRFRPQAEIILMLVKGANLNRTLNGAPDEALMTVLSGVLDRLIGEIVAAPAGDGSGPVALSVPVPQPVPASQGGPIPARNAAPAPSALPAADATATDPAAKG